MTRPEGESWHDLYRRNLLWSIGAGVAAVGGVALVAGAWSHINFIQNPELPTSYEHAALASGIVGLGAIALGTFMAVTANRLLGVSRNSQN